MALEGACPLPSRRAFRDVRKPAIAIILFEHAEQHLMIRLQVALDERVRNRWRRATVPGHTIRRVDVNLLPEGRIRQANQEIDVSLIRHLCQPEGTCPSSVAFSALFGTRPNDGRREK